MLTPEQMRSSSSRAPPTRTKGDFGRVTLVAGSMGKTGAAHLAAMGALRSGAGLVTVATPRSCLPIVAAYGAGIHDRPLCQTTPAGTLDASGVDQLLEQSTT